MHVSKNLLNNEKDTKINVLKDFKNIFVEVNPPQSWT